MLVIALCYSLYNLKNLEQGRYGPLCVWQSGRQRIYTAVSAVSEAASCARLPMPCLRRKDARAVTRRRYLDCEGRVRFKNLRSWSGLRVRLRVSFS
jgi:hypothetical protein